MGQSSNPPPIAILPPLAPAPSSQLVVAPSPSLPNQVRCAGCKMILKVGPGVTEFVCPICQLPQKLPPEMMGGLPLNNKRTPHTQAHGIDPSKIQLPCAHCKAILNVPHGLSRFACPQCGIDLVVDVQSSGSSSLLPCLPRK